MQKKKRAKRLDKILNALVRSKPMTQEEISNKINMRISRDDMSSIKAKKYNNSDIVITSTDGERTHYTILNAGIAFRNESGFFDEWKEQRFPVKHLWFTGISVGIALAALIVSVINSCN